MKSARSSGDVAAAMTALLCLAAGFEMYLRFSGTGWTRIVSLPLGLLGLLLLAWPRRENRTWVPRLAVGVLVMAYVVQAAWRYPGLLKEPRPFGWQDVLFFSGKIAAALLLGSLAMNMVVRGCASLFGRKWDGSGWRI